MDRGRLKTHASMPYISCWLNVGSPVWIAREVRVRFHTSARDTAATGVRAAFDARHAYPPPLVLQEWQLA